MKHLILTLSLVMGGCLYAQTTAPLVPYRKGENWGYSTPDKQQKVAYAYRAAIPFSNGWGSVQDADDKWHVVSAKGKVSRKGIEANFIAFLSRKVAVFSQGNKYGLMTPKGKVLAAAAYDDFINFYGNAATWVKLNGKYGAINPKGKLVIPAVYDLVQGPEHERFAVKKEGKIALFTTKGKRLTPFTYDQINWSSDGLYAVQQGKNWKIIDEKQQILADLGEQYSFVGAFEGGLARVSKSGKWGFIDKNGKEVVPAVHGSTGCLGEGLFVYSEEKGEAIINATGKVVRKVGGASSFVNGRAIYYENDKSGFLNPQGGVAVPASYERITDFFNGNFTVVSKDEQHDIIIDQNGKEWYTAPAGIRLSAEEGDIFSCYDEEDVLKGFIDAKGTEFWED